MSRRDETLVPVGGTLWTPSFTALAAFSGFAMLVVLARFVLGLGAVTALNDGYSWGAWKVLNVVVFTALGSGGYAMALLVYVLNRGHYHSLVRQALLTSAVGYSTAILALGVDIGRPWNMWRLVNVGGWNLRSVLLEIAVCVTLYVGLLWVEMAPPLLEAWSAGPRGRLKRFATAATPVVDRIFPWMLALALVLPSMHQSSLGALFLLAGPRLHPYWQTPYLPLLFLLSCYAMGFAAVVLTAIVSYLRWRRPLPLAMLARLARVMGLVLFAFVTLRVSDLAARGVLAGTVRLDRYTLLFVAEAALFLLAAVALVRQKVRAHPAVLFRAAFYMAAGGTLYRLNAALTGFMPGHGWVYFPSVLEEVVSLGFVAMAALGYVYVIKRFPILHLPPAPEGRAYAEDLA